MVFLIEELGKFWAACCGPLPAVGAVGSLAVSIGLLLDSFWHCLFFCIAHMMRSEEVLAVLGGGDFGFNYL